MNAESSRSHAIMTVIVEQWTIVQHVGVESEDTESGHPEIELNYQNFILLTWQVVKDKSGVKPRVNS